MELTPINIVIGLIVGLTAINGAATVDTPAVRLNPPVTTTTTIPTGPPTPSPGDCDSWADVFRWYGATDNEIQFFFGNARPWGVSRTNIIRGETLCGTRFVNPDTSDRGICQTNGVHARAGYFWGRQYGPGGWLMAEFGLRGGRAVGEAEASNPAYAAACLFMLRGGSHTPDRFGGACAWAAPRFCE